MQDANTTQQSTQSNKTMLTDLYQLTMMAGYHSSKKDNDLATFDLFIRKLPENWNYFIAAGIEDAIDYATSIKFTDSDIQYLRGQKLFTDEFLETLKGFRFTGEIYAVREGTPIFPNEPILRVTARRSEAQFLETALLNIINHQTLIASKASRIVEAAKPAAVVDFGLRRAQGEDAGMEGAKAAYIAGAVGTSNVKAGKEYGIPIKGTQAHSFVMSFDSEIEAFRAYAKAFPDTSTLLIDTYDTLQGAKNAAIVGKELELEGHKLQAVRLDSGDLAELSKRVRETLDSAGLDYVKIFASNDLNEYKIAALRKAGARIGAYGVGTEMITAKPVSAISGVYKLVEDESGPKIKLSEGKKSYPGRKQVYRNIDGIEHLYTHDVIALESEKENELYLDKGISLLQQAVKEGKRVSPRPSLETTREYCLDEVRTLPWPLKGPNADSYGVYISEDLNHLVEKLEDKHSAHKKVETEELEEALA